jgi:hypothetical protein
MEANRKLLIKQQALEEKNVALRELMDQVGGKRLGFKRHRLGSTHSGGNGPPTEKNDSKETRHIQRRYQSHVFLAIGVKQSDLEVLADMQRRIIRCTSDSTIAVQQQAIQPAIEEPRGYSQPITSNLAWKNRRYFGS